MNLTDPIADLFTRIRNGIHARHEEVLVPHSKLKASIVDILKVEGYIISYEVEEKEKGKKNISIKLKYNTDGSSIITSIQRSSLPGKRLYVKKAKVPKVRNGFGTCLLSTSKGILDGRSARLANVGGELIGIVY